MNYRQRRFELAKEIGDKIKELQMDEKLKSNPLWILKWLTKLAIPMGGRHAKYLHAQIIRKVTWKRIDHLDVEKMLRNWFEQRGADFKKIPQELQTYYVLWGAFKVINRLGRMPKRREIEKVVETYFKEGGKATRKKVRKLLEYLCS